MAFNTFFTRLRRLIGRDSRPIPAEQGSAEMRAAQQREAEDHHAAEEARRRSERQLKADEDGGS